MTMADRIAIMNAGRIEQLGAPSDLYEKPQTAFVASFLGISNLLQGTVTGPGSVRLDDGTDVRVPESILNGRSGKVAVGVRPEKIRLGHGEENRLTGRLLETRLRRRRHAVRARDAGRQRQRLRPEQRARRRRAGAEPRSRGARTPRSSSIRWKERNDRPAHAAAAAQAGSHRRCRDHVPRDPRRLRQQRHEGLRGHDQRRAEACEHAALLELDALHRHEQQDELAPVARRRSRRSTGVNVDYVEDINDNASFFGKIQGPLSRGQSINRDIIVLTDNDRYLGADARGRAGPRSSTSRRSRT